METTIMIIGFTLTAWAFIFTRWWVKQVINKKTIWSDIMINRHYSLLKDQLAEEIGLMKESAKVRNMLNQKNTDALKRQNEYLIKALKEANDHNETIRCSHIARFRHIEKQLNKVKGDDCKHENKTEVTNASSKRYEYICIKCGRHIKGEKNKSKLEKYILNDMADDIRNKLKELGAK